MDVFNFSKRANFTRKKKIVQLFLTNLKYSHLIETNFPSIYRTIYSIERERKRETVFLFTDNINSINVYVDEHTEQNVNKHAFSILVPRIFAFSDSRHLSFSTS